MCADGATMLCGPEAEPAADMIGIGASAGGLRALSRLPPALPAAIAVVQHIDPRCPSMMARLLGRCTALSVVEASAGCVPRPGMVYVAPPDRHLVIGRDGRLGLSSDDPIHYVRPAVDRLLASLAQAYGGRAIAVILSGSGVDGADGVRAVKANGGAVIIQDEATSEFFGMPGAALRTACVDRVLPLDQIAPALIALLAARAQS